VKSAINSAPVGPRLGWIDKVRAYARSRWGKHARKWIWGQVLFIWGLTQALPVDILDQLPFLKSMCAPIVGEIPYISTYVDRSSFPQVTELILCIGWLIAPLNIVFGIVFPEYMHKGKPRTVFGNLMDIKPEGKGFNGFFFAGVVMLILIPALIWLFLTVPVFDPKYGIGDSALLSFNVRFTFGFVGQVVSNGLGLLAAAWIVAMGHFIGFFLSFFSK